MTRLLILLTVLVVQASCRPHQIEKKMYVEKSTSDLGTSASGYIYQNSGHGPASFVKFGEGPLVGAHGHLLAHPYAYNPVQYVHQTQYVPQYEQVKPVQVYEDHMPISMPEYGHVMPEMEHGIEAVDEESAKYGFQDEGHDDGGVQEVEQEEEEEDKGESYEQDGGEESEGEHQASEGEKGEKGYKSKHEYEKGEQGKHDKEGHKGFYSDVGGNKKKHEDEGEYYDEHHKSDKGNKGAKFHESKEHKKGSKTTGFHNVYHKDEYKKDHTFYDESDNSGHFEKHGEGNQQHASAAGGHKKGGNGESGYHDEHYGKKGFHDKGHHLDEGKGFNGKKGHDEYYNEHEKYGKKGESSKGSEYGHSDGGKYYH